jgi:hypothetical protein
MRTHFSSVLFSLLLAASPGRAVNTALEAVKALPEGVGKNLARIEAPEGNPEPRRWHILVHDANAENGLREYVVSDGEVVAAREVSQFAERLSANDVIGVDAVRVNSDKLAAVAQQYAAVNNVTISSINYELRKEGTAALPVWRIGCLDSKGQPLGALLVSADAGKIVSREGFPNTPLEPVSQLELEAPVALPSPPPVQVVEQIAPSADDRRAETAEVKPKKKQATADSHRQPQKTNARREEERPPAAVAELAEAGDERDPSAQAQPVAKKKTEVRKPRTVTVRRAIPVTGQPAERVTERTETKTTGRETAAEMEPFYEPPRHDGPLLRAVRRLVPFAD